MLLSKYNLKNIVSQEVVVPDRNLFDLPERVLQFGTGVLLRGLPDYFIDKANKQGLFNGRIVVVKSTETNDTGIFEKQDGLYTICEKGFENCILKEENIISAAISRVLSAKTEWNKILECAHNPQLQVIISNTTEAGIELVNDDILSYPPVSFPGKLLAFLYERFKAFAGSSQCGMVIVPTELIPDNGVKLESIVTELAYLNGLDESFIDWLENHNHFCNSLVDRIVPGKPDTTVKSAIEKKLGYSDELLIICEPYRLWAIEGGKEIEQILSFARVNSGVVVTKDIDLFRELKLRLLNGTHTLSCGIAFLAGFHSVSESMDNQAFSIYLGALMDKEISRAIPYDINPRLASEFALKVMDRFRNPAIRHQWISISFQFTSKMKMRVLPVLLQFYTRFNKVPENIALGFAAYLLFMKVEKEEDGHYFGKYNGNYYPVKDDKAGYFYEKWDTMAQEPLAASVLKDIALWGFDLGTLPGFIPAVQKYMTEILELGMTNILQLLTQKKLLT